MITPFTRRYATGNFSYAMPTLKRRPKFKPSLRDEEQARLASKIQRAKMWVMTRMSSCPTNNSSDLNTEVETAVTVVAWAALGRVKRLLSAFERLHLAGNSGTVKDGIEKKLERGVRLSAFQNLRSEQQDLSLPHIGFDCHHAVFQMLLSPCPSAAQRGTAIEPRDCLDAL